MGDLLVRSLIKRRPSLNAVRVMLIPTHPAGCLGLKTNPAELQIWRIFGGICSESRMILRFSKRIECSNFFVYAVRRYQDENYVKL